MKLIERLKENIDEVSAFTPTMCKVRYEVFTTRYIGLEKYKNIRILENDQN